MDKETVSEDGSGQKEENIRDCQRKGIPEEQKKGRKFCELTPYHDIIYKAMREGVHQAEIIRRLWDHGYKGSKSNAAYYVKELREAYGIKLPRRVSREKKKSVKGILINGVVMTERELMDHLWRGKLFNKEERAALYERHPNLLTVEYCVKEFKNIFKRKHMPYLYVFIENYAASTIKALSGFAKGLQNDLDAVENAVASEKSNGFVEGTNNRIKMIKRTMFGRCGNTLLSVKLMMKKWQPT